VAIERDEILKVAKLARLKLSEEETENFGQDLNKIIAYVEKLAQVDTSGISPIGHVNPPGQNLREDTLAPQTDREERLKNAPEKEDGFIVVPKVV